MTDPEIADAIETHTQELRGKLAEAREMLAFYVEQKRKVTAQRDGLLEAAKTLLAHHRIAHPPTMTDTLRERIESLQSAITQAEGEA